MYETFINKSKTYAYYGRAGFHESLTSPSNRNTPKEGREYTKQHDPARILKSTEVEMLVCRCIPFEDDIAEISNEHHFVLGPA